MRLCEYAAARVVGREGAKPFGPLPRGQFGAVVLLDAVSSERAVDGLGAFALISVI